MKVFRKLLKNFSQDVSDEQKSNTDVVRNTFEQNTEDSSNLNYSKLHLAVLSEQENEVKKYATKRNINKQDSSKRTALHIAVYLKNASIIRILLAQNASTEIYDDEGFTPYLRAVETGNIDLVKIFGDRKLNRNQTDCNGNTALHLAVTYGFCKIVNFLAKNNSLVDIPNKAGDYPLHAATQNESFSIAKILLDNHALVDVEDKMKRTPLLMAVRAGNLSLVELFLHYEADPSRCDMNGVSVRESALLSKNLSIRKLINGSDQTDVTNYGVKKKMPISDEDSHTSESSYILPPILEAPRSWNMLHPNDKTLANPRISKNKKLYRRNVKSLSPDFSENIFQDELVYANRRKSFSSTHVSDEHLDSTKYSSFAKEWGKSQFENCRKVLDELSLDKLHQCPNLKPTNKENEVYSVSISNHSSHKLPLLNDSVANETLEDVSNKEPRIFGKNFTEDYNLSDSSDEDPLFWKNSLDGGYFTGNLSYKNPDKIAAVEYNSSSSEENSDDECRKNVNNSILDHLKRTTRENEDLETEATVLREAAEKLKYDLANYRIQSDDKERSLNFMNRHVAQLDSKYLTAIQKMNTFQLHMSNMQQEISYLRNICDQIRRPNRQLMAKRKDTCGNDTSILSDVEIPSHQNDFHTLHADITYWKSKYKEVADKTSENCIANFNMQHLISLNVELNRLDGKMKDCLSKTDFAQLQNQQDSMAIKMMQQVLDEANRKLQSSLAEIRSDIEVKLHEKGLSENDERLRQMENENTRREMLLEISKLSAQLKEKENTEQLLIDQLSDLRDEIRKLKEENRKSLSKDTDEIHFSLQ